MRRLAHKLKRRTGTPEPNVAPPHDTHCELGCLSVIVEAQLKEASLILADDATAHGDPAPQGVGSKPRATASGGKFQADRSGMCTKRLMASVLALAAWCLGETSSMLRPICLRPNPTAGTVGPAQSRPCCNRMCGPFKLCRHFVATRRCGDEVLAAFVLFLRIFRLLAENLEILKLKSVFDLSPQFLQSPNYQFCLDRLQV